MSYKVELDGQKDPIKHLEANKSSIKDKQKVLSTK